MVIIKFVISKLQATNNLAGIIIFISFLTENWRQRGSLVERRASY